MKGMSGGWGKKYILFLGVGLPFPSNARIALQSCVGGCLHPLSQASLHYPMVV